MEQVNIQLTVALWQLKFLNPCNDVNNNIEANKALKIEI